MEKQLINRIDVVLEELDALVSDFKHYSNNDREILDARLVFRLLKKEVIKGGLNSINERLLRAVHDMGMSSFKDFENTSLEDSIPEVTGILRSEIRQYKNLKPLGIEFGKGNPI